MRLLRFASVAWGLGVAAGAVLCWAPARAADPQMLASSCTGCHSNSATLTTAIPRIRGLPKAVILDAMRAFQTGQRPSTVMDRIAKGFTEDEIKQLATYFGAR